MLITPSGAVMARNGRGHFFYLNFYIPVEIRLIFACIRRLALLFPYYASM
jgi:hypothetical protein